MSKRRVVLIFLCVLFLVILAVLGYKYANTLNRETYAEELNISEEKVDKLTLKMVGDNLIHNTIYFAAKNENGYNFDMLFENVKDEIEEADISIINQETIFVKDPKRYSSYPTFGSPTEVGDSIVKAGFDVVAHATNHTLDKGVSGVNDTLSFWKEKYPDIEVLGIHENEEESDITYIEKNNIKLSFVNYTYGLNGMTLPKDKLYMVDLLNDDEGLKNNIKEAKENSDIMIAILHIGTEYVYNPSTYHKKYVDMCIDSGADIVLCAHPHVLEPYKYVTTEKGNTGLVYYSLGNFVSNQRKVPTLLGGMADIELIRNEDGNVEISKYDLIPLVTHYINGFYTTYRLDEYTDELAKEHKISETNEFSTKILWDLFNEIISY